MTIVADETKSMTGRIRIGDCLNVYDNDDALLRRYVLQNFERDQAAYWTISSYHSQKLAAFAYRANRMGVGAGDDEMYLQDAAEIASAPYRGQSAPLIQCYDSLIPLNERAARDLAEAYAQSGRFVDEDELLMRRFKKMPS